MTELPNSTLELPIVNLSADINTIVEGEKAQLLTFHLSEPSPTGGLTVKLNIGDSDGESADTEFPLELISNIVDFGQVEEDGTITASLTIAEGETEATFGISAIADNLDEGDETYSLTLLPDEDYVADSDSTTITTTIKDNMTLPTVSITPENVSVIEGETFAWNISLSQPAPAGGLSLSLPIIENNDPEPGDVEYNIDGSSGIADFEFVLGNDVSESFSITIAEGETEAVLVSQAISDDLEEGDEIFTTAIAQGDGYLVDSDQNEVTTTIFDRDTSTDLPTISVVAEPTEVEEGSQLLWNFSLTEAVGEGGFTVALDLVEDTDPLPGDIEYFVEGSENVTDFELIINEESGLIDRALVTLAEGATSATLVNDIIADNVTEGEESVSFALAESEGYAIDSEVNAADFTILDTSTDLVTSTSTSISFELDDLLVPARDAVVDVTFDLDYVSGIEDSEFLPVGEIADSIENYLANNPADGDFFEVITEDLAEFLVNDSGLGIGSVSESLTVELAIEPNSVIPFPFVVTSTIEDINTFDASSNNSSSVEIINPGFEEPTLEDGEFTLTSEDTEIPGWTLYNPDSLDVDLALADAGAWNPPEEQYPNGIPGGDNVGYTFVDSSLLGTGEIGLQQTTEELLAADTEYTLTVDIANATGGDEFGDYSGFPGYRIELLAGQEIIAVDDNSLSIEEGSFGTSTITYNAAEDDSFLGHNLGIRLVNLNADSGLEVDFDNVSLTAM